MGTPRRKGKFGAERVHAAGTLGYQTIYFYLFYRSRETFPISRTSILMAASVSSGCYYSHPETDYGNGWNSGVILLTWVWVAAGRGPCFPSHHFWSPLCTAPRWKDSLCFKLLLPAQKLGVVLHFLQDQILSAYTLSSLIVSSSYVGQSQMYRKTEWCNKHPDV